MVRNGKKQHLMYKMSNQILVLITSFTYNGYLESNQTFYDCQIGFQIDQSTYS